MEIEISMLVDRIQVIDLLVFDGFEKRMFWKHN